jgi:hypothetical protein
MSVLLFVFLEFQGFLLCFSYLLSLTLLPADALTIKSILNCNLLAISSAGEIESASGTVRILLAAGGLHLGLPPTGN